MVSEKYMKPIVDFLIRKIYGEPEHTIHEFPVGYGRTDIVYIFEGEPYVVSVELKVNNWKRGVQQALRNLVFSKYSYLALQWKKKRRIDMDFLRKYGIGLIAVNGDAQVVLKPKPSSFFNLYRREIMKMLRDKIE